MAQNVTLVWLRRRSHFCCPKNVDQTWELGVWAWLEILRMLSELGKRSGLVTFGPRLRRGPNVIAGEVRSWWITFGPHWKRGPNVTAVSFPCSPSFGGCHVWAMSKPCQRHGPNVTYACPWELGFLSSLLECHVWAKFETWPKRDFGSSPG
ncbi:hypothetical protein PIB30_101562 [Stylosanthes scabra]|uniref:Uncharacterized protein n=1 Tax=Stylosanthes scabra TaxID=79078 RepID=A0ABU6XYD1_9FABA|nr:hypothetical protein [Stylosanthes scabra]